MSLQLVLAATLNKFLEVEHHHSMVYSRYKLILMFFAGATTDLTCSNKTGTAGND